MNREDVKHAISAVCKEAGETLATRCFSVYAKLTPAEVEKFAVGGELYASRLAKTLLIAIADKEIDRQFNAETIKGNVPKVRRIDNRRY